MKPFPSGPAGRNPTLIPLAVHLVAGVLVVVGATRSFSEIHEADRFSEQAGQIERKATRALRQFAEAGSSLSVVMLDPAAFSDWETFVKSGEESVRELKFVRDSTPSSAIRASATEAVNAIEKLDASRAELGKLVREGRTKEIQKFYSSTYLPARSRTETLVRRVSELGSVEASEKVEASSRLLQSTSTRVVASFGGLLLALLGLHAWSAFRLSRRTSQMIDDLEKSRSPGPNLLNLSNSNEELERRISQAAALAKAGRELARGVAQEVSALHGAESVAREASQSLESLGAHFEVLQGVAQESRLLAFNATIEAARAGAAGKGFSVIAEEISRLSSLTGKATEDLRGGLLLARQKITTLASGANSGARAAKVGTQRCEQSFIEITDALQSGSAPAFPSWPQHLKERAPAAPQAAQPIAPPKFRIVTPPKFKGPTQAPAAATTEAEELRWKVG